MHRRTVTVRRAGKAFPLNDEGLEGVDQLELASELAESLISAGCYPLGTQSVLDGRGGFIVDPDWGSDLGEFIARAEPHEKEVDGKAVRVSLKLDTLKAEVDGHGEVCAWVYTED